MKERDGGDALKNSGIGMVSPIRGVIFDLDGTLLDSLEDIALTMNDVLEARGYAPFRVEEYKALVGDGIEEMVRRAFALRGVPDLPELEIAAVVAEYRSGYKSRWRHHTRPYPGVPELLQELGRRGLRTAVLSNKSHAFTTLMTAELFDPHRVRFDVVRGALPGVPLKPDPAPARAVAAELGLAPATIAFLGDTSVDMMTAVAAGMVPFGALWGFRSAEELRSSGAAALLASPLDLLGLIG